MSIIITLLIFCVIVVIHEGGHFAAARLSGVTVEEFAVGIGPTAASAKLGKTVYSLRWLPLGGFCRMADYSDEETGKVGFLDISVYKRIFICAAGPFMNFLLAVIVLSFLNFAVQYQTTEIKNVSRGYPAAEAGIMAGDRVTHINGERIRIYSELSYKINESGNNAINITVERAGQSLDFVIAPKLDDDGVYRLGILPESKSGFLYPVEGLPKTELAESVYCGFFEMFFLIKMTAVGLVQLFTARLSMDSVAGPIGLTAVIGEVYSQSVSVSILIMIISMLNITALLSANLGIMNLLPIPALDGGKILVYLIEVVRRKPIAPEKEGIINLIGAIFIMGLGVLVAFHDIFNIFS